MIENESPTMAQVIQDAIKQNLFDLHVCLPARVESYDYTTQKADVKPLLKKKFKKKQAATELPVIPSVPVQWPSANGGKTFIHLPLKTDDLGIVVICDRSIDSWLSGDGQITDPAEPRHHDLSDAVFIPGVRPFKVALANTSASNLVIQNDKLKLELDPSGKISITGVNELISVLSDLIDHLVNAKVLTMMGPQPFIASTIANLQSDKAKLDTFKI